MSRRPPRTRRPCLRPVGGGLLAALSVALAACSGIERAGPQPKSARADRSFDLNAPRMMRGTIAAESVMLGYQPVVARGYGLVVGLKGTGARDFPPSLRAHMLAEMGRRGVGQRSRGLGEINPERLLDSPDTAVVIVEGVVPPGAVGRQVHRGARIDGSKFDVRVYADPRTGTTSLDGGRLFTTELRPGNLTTGSRQAFAIAEARGPIFINPFAAPGTYDISGDTIDRTVGRILNGGEVLKDIPIKLRLATPSHARAEIVQNSINSRFPQEPGQANRTAHGESAESILLTVPPSYRSDPEEFIELLRHTTIRLSGVEAVASSIKRILLNDPGQAFDAAWRWQALGQRALPTVRTLYDYPEERPRLAALRAGSRLGDAVAITYLIEMSEIGSADGRREAVELMATLPLDPRVDQALNERLSDASIDVRLVAYESLVGRADPRITRHYVDKTFELDIVSSDYPMIYVTQVTQPRIVVFGHDLSIDRPVLVDAWTGRLMIKADSADEKVEVYYRPDDGGPRIIEQCEPGMEEIVRFLGHRTTVDEPKPGLGLSYSETVGALYQIWRQDYVQADFKADQDRVLAAIRRQEEDPEVRERPEFSDPDFDFLRPEADGGSAADPSMEDVDELAPPPAIGSSPERR